MLEGASGGAGWGGSRESSPEVTVRMDNPEACSFNPFLLLLHRLLAPKHAEGEFVDPRLQHGGELPLHETILPPGPLGILEAARRLLSSAAVHLEAHGVAMFLPGRAAPRRGPQALVGRHRPRRGRLGGEDAVAIVAAVGRGVGFAAAFHARRTRPATARAPDSPGARSQGAGAGAGCPSRRQRRRRLLLPARPLLRCAPGSRRRRCPQWLRCRLCRAPGSAAPGTEAEAEAAGAGRGSSARHPRASAAPRLPPAGRRPPLPARAPPLACATSAQRDIELLSPPRTRICTFGGRLSGCGFAKVGGQKREGGGGKGEEGNDRGKERWKEGGRGGEGKDRQTDRQTDRD
jgi:hypothetical protein